MTTPLGDFFRHNRWANLRLADALTQLNDEQLAATVAGTFGGIFTTLVHLAVNEERYLKLLRGEPMEIDWHKASPDLATVRAHLAASGDGLVAYAENYQPDGTAGGMFGGHYTTVPTITVLLQAINHATMHRTDITTVMAHHGWPTPDLDGWAYGEATHAESAGE